MRTMKVSTKTKGIIAAVAGGALLLGSGATFAFWSDDATIEGTTITSGHLAVEDAAMAWTFTGPGGPGDVGTDFLMIPGHTVTGVGTITPELAGTGLEAKLTVNGGALATTPASTELTVTWEVDGDTYAGAAIEIDGLNPTNIPATGIPIEVTIEFPAGSTGTMDTDVALSNFGVTLTQVLPTP